MLSLRFLAPCVCVLVSLSSVCEFRVRCSRFGDWSKVLVLLRGLQDLAAKVQGAQPQQQLQQPHSNNDGGKINEGGARGAERSEEEQQDDEALDGGSGEGDEMGIINNRHAGFGAAAAEYHQTHHASEEEQKRHAVALIDRVGKRIQGDMRGSLKQSSDQLSVAEHVAWMIQQASSPDNLCSMYEGWAAWI